MSEKSGIEWTDHTFNPWWGCAKISPGCDNCYALRDAQRYQPGKKLWGLSIEGATRRTFGENHWNEPLRWNRAAQREGRRAKVVKYGLPDTDYWMDPLHPQAPWKVHWVIVGGESGPKARGMIEGWVDPILAACRITDTAFFFKQGSQANWPAFKQYESFPSHLQVREWPRGTVYGDTVHP